MATEFLASTAIPPPLLLRANEFMVKFDCVKLAPLISSSEGLNHVSVMKRMSKIGNKFLILLLFSSVPTDLALKRPMRNDSLHVDFDERLLMIFISIKFPGLQPI